MQEETDHIYRERLDFSKIKSAFPMPDLLAIQKQSYADFLQMDLLPDERKDVGCKRHSKIFSLCPILKKPLNWISSIILSVIGSANAGD